MDRITNLEGAVRDFINTGRHQGDLLKSRESWNQICSSLDVIGDTVLCIRDYVASPYPSSDGLKYIYTYGILQALFLQQDAVRHLSEAFAVSHPESPTLMRIRDIRNAAIGHPTKQNIKKVNHYNYISRVSLSKTGFTLLRSSPDDDTKFVDVDLTGIVEEQLRDIEVALSSVADKLKAADRLHREKFGGRLISDVFHSSTGYMFEKVGQGVHSSSQGDRSFGLSMLESIEKMYSQFKAALEERRELSEYTRFDLDEYKHAISVLKEYLSGNPKEISESDARIYLFYLREQHEHKFVKIAEEVDDEYEGGEV
ncbi:hypothetical protein [Aquabacterium sp. J223]|uniref:hypothetical protein n=1 Tax=Aquabacterium sp. J223 TaxID=2898431 RepID=UPI0021AE2877|nr:hypothetical protein [Aquabacterium sp. J223]UUX97317.1 hypothetical protein LRS07_08780 [Aquabacterium sp. J223]